MGGGGVEKEIVGAKGVIKEPHRRHQDGQKKPDLPQRPQPWPDGVLHQLEDGKEDEQTVDEKAVQVHEVPLRVGTPIGEQQRRCCTRQAEGVDHLPQPIPMPPGKEQVEQGRQLTQVEG